MAAAKQQLNSNKGTVFSVLSLKQQKIGVFRTVRARML
jgi:hypothetical protein